MRNTLMLLLLMLLSLFSSAASINIINIKRPLITGISSVAFYAKDVKSDRLFYVNYLGLPESNSSSLTKDEKNGSSVFEVSQRQSIKIIPTDQISGDRLAYFSIETDNAEDMRRYLAGKGVEVPCQPLKKTHGTISFFIKDPNGTICQIIQKKAVAPSSKFSGNGTGKGKIASKMSHVGFMVADVDRAVEFYQGVLGFKETWRGSKDNKNVSWVNLKVPDGDEYIELMLYDKIQSAENMGVLNHVCLEVDDVTKTSQKLLDRVLPPNCKATTPVKTGINKKRQINSFDVEGTRIEIMEAQAFDGKPAGSSGLKPLKFWGIDSKN